MALLCVCAQWHTLAKLRLHNDYTLDLLEYTTTQLGAHLRRFYRDTCLKFPTKELQREAEARARKELKTGKGAGSSARKPASLGIFTIKFHYLGDYVSTIRRFGTTDSYSSQTVSANIWTILTALTASIGRTLSPRTKILVSSDGQEGIRRSAISNRTSPS